jgi:hypothetical protein
LQKNEYAHSSFFPIHGFIPVFLEGENSAYILRTIKALLKIFFYRIRYLYLIFVPVVGT